MSSKVETIKETADEIATEIFKAVDEDAIFGHDSVREIILYAVAKGYEAGLNEKP
ncbi:hypothetical protein VRU48_03960 [Pedobacter sp. KR3-3]|uniref:Uncharacterized protein n=1 Tax=Pedobacter albus TaxID=3113905 RepID=A0ABU7I466_9SPHI|nr:hypothetical protein [Pedobacter sp. KR3-3]MEE1944249.1 hypothetical protein [Pedobacter sp. KR3-3]